MSLSYDIYDVYAALGAALLLAAAQAFGTMSLIWRLVMDGKPAQDIV